MYGRLTNPAVFAVIVFLVVPGCKNRDAEKTTPAPAAHTESKAPERKAAGFAVTAKEKRLLLDIARETVDSWVKDRKVPEFDTPEGILIEDGAAFVTLRKHGKLRGCIGHIIAREPLWLSVRNNAVNASSRDRRFPPVKPDELSEITVEVSVLTPPEPVKNPTDIILGTDGVIVRKGFRSGVYLPQVATETGWDRETFLSTLCSHKAGLKPDCHYDPDVTLLKFQAIVFEEPEKQKIK